MESNIRYPRLLLLCILSLLLFQSQSFGQTSTGTAAGVATFHCIGITWSGSGGNASTICNVKYRVAGSGAAWKNGYPLWFDSRAVGGRPSNEYRGSLVNLTPGTNYEIELSAGSSTNTFTSATWNENFPIGTTQTVANGSATLNITTSGTATGYRLYTPATGGSATINVNNGADNCIYINAAYVIVRGLVLQGAKADAIKLGPNAHDIVIERNDISGWGRVGSDMDAGVRVANQGSVTRIIIQRNKIHHPRSNANSWEEGGHPAGPQGISFETAGGNHVIRYNEIYSEPGHYFNDGIGGGENFSYEGFPRANSDIYGNIVKNTWDDGIESEGANMNVRIWGNYLDSTFVKIAIAATSVGPIYIFRNVANVSRRSAANGSTADNEDRGPFIKAGSSYSQFQGGKIYVLHNTLLQPARSGFTYTLGCGGGILDWGGGPMTPVESRNNILHIHKTNWQSVGENEGGSGSTYDYDLYNANITASGNQESHGIKNTPVYNPNNAPGTWFLASTSNGYDDGQPLNNFSDGYTGTAPDMGAYEAGTAPLEFGVDAYSNGAPPPPPPPAGNIPPVAEAGNTITLTLPTNSTTLNGSGTDADGTITSYAWSRVSGPTTFTFANANAAATALTNLVQGTYLFRLTITDNGGATATDDIVVIVNAAANQPPTANAGNNITLTLPTNSTTLNGSGTDTDGTIASYAWSRVSGPTTFTFANANAASTALSNLIPGTYVFRLTVTDNDGATATDNITVVVNAAPVANQPPTANAGNNITIVLPTNSTTLQGSGVDADGTIASYAWAMISGSNTYSIGNINAATTNINNLAAGTYIFSLTVTDNDGAIASDYMAVTVLSAPSSSSNQAPTANAGNNITLTLPTNSTTLNGSGTDADGTIASYKWTKISGSNTYSLANSNAATTALSNLVQGVYVFSLTVTDNDGATGIAFVTINVNALANQPPTVNAGNNITLTLPTNSTTLSGSGTDPDGTIASYKWAKISGPATYTLANSNAATTGLSNLVQGAYVFSLTVTDNIGASAIAYKTVTVNAAPPAANQPPIANAGTDIIMTLPTNSTSLNGSASSDPDGTIISYAWVRISGPNFYTVATPNTAISSLTNLVQGIYVFRLTVIDNNGLKTSDNVTITINAAAPAANQPPVAKAGSDIILTLPENATILYGSSSTDADGTITAYLWKQVSGPTTATISNSTVSNTEVSNLVIGEYVFELKVTDNRSASSTAKVKVTVKNKNGDAVFCNVYPNPATDKLNVQYMGNIRGDVKITIYDMNKRIVFETNVVKDQVILVTQIDISRFAKGTYIMHAALPGSLKISKKFVKM